MRAVAAVGKVRLDVADDADGRVLGRTTEVLQSLRFAGLDGNARVGIGGATVRFITQQQGSSSKKADLHDKPRYQKGWPKNRLERGDSKQSGGYAVLIKKDFLFDKPRIC